MRVLVAAGLISIGLVQAEAASTVTTEHYTISGSTGQALLSAMDRNGPKQGYLARAMAQTRYTLGWDLRWDQSGSSCKLKRAVARLSISYRYPRPAGPLPADLKRRWNVFMKAVRTHEEVHGRIAKQMANAAERSIANISTPNDPGCSRSQSEVQRRVNRIVAMYEERQRSFDANEHRPGGHVTKVVNSLLGRGR